MCTRRLVCTDKEAGAPINSGMGTDAATPRTNTAPSHPSCNAELSTPGAAAPASCPLHAASTHATPHRNSFARAFTALRLFRTPQRLRQTDLVPRRRHAQNTLLELAKCRAAMAHRASSATRCTRWATASPRSGPKRSTTSASASASPTSTRPVSTGTRL